METREVLRQGMALQDAGQLDQAAQIYKRILETNPKQINALQLMGQVALQSGELQLAQQLLERAISLKPDLGPAWRDLGYAANATGDSARARECLVSAVKFMPRDAGLSNDLGALLSDMGEIEASIMYFEAAIALNPDDPSPYSNLALSLNLSSLSAEALVACDRAVALSPDFAKAHATRAMALRDLGRPLEAVAAFDRCLQLDGDFVPALVFKGAAQLEAGRPQDALDTLEASLVKDPFNRSALAFKAIALGELGMHRARAHLLDYERLVRRARVLSPPTFGSVDKLNAALAAHVRAHPTLVYEPASKPTRAGSQTGNLLVGEKGPMTVLERLINEAVKAYFESLPADFDHPYAKVRLPAWDLVAWATILGREGHQQPHIHPESWLSGVYYVEVPEFAGPAESKSGWIEFGTAPASFKSTRKAATMRYQPEPGLILLFPSYFYHATVPYGDDAARISIGFDVIPKRPD